MTRTSRFAMGATLMAMAGCAPRAPQLDLSRVEQARVVPPQVLAAPAASEDGALEKAPSPSCGLPDHTSIRPSDVVVVLMDASGSMSGEPLQIVVQATREGIRALEPTTWVGIVVFDRDPRIAAELTSPDGGEGKLMRALRDIEPGGGADVYPALTLAQSMLEDCPTERRRMLLILESRTPPTGLLELARDLFSKGIQLSTLAVGPDSDTRLLAELAREGGGQFREADLDANLSVLLTASLRGE